MNLFDGESGSFVVERSIRRGITALPILPAFILYNFCHRLDFFSKTKTQTIFFSVVYFLLAWVLFLQAINAIRSFLIS